MLALQPVLAAAEVTGDDRVTHGLSEALAIGLVNRVVDTNLLDAGVEYARTVCRHSLPVLDLVTRAVRRAGETSLHEGLKSEAELSALSYATEDGTEGMQAFLDKRKPVFRDR